MFIFYVIALYTFQLGVTPTEYQCFQDNNPVDWFFVYKLPGGKSSHYLLPAAADWTAAAEIDAAQQPIHSTMNKYFGAGNKDHANIVAYSNYPPHFKFELPMSPGKGLIIAEEQNKGFWLVHTAKYFPNLAGVIGDLFSNEKTTKDAAAFLCMSYSDVNLKAIAEIQTLINGLHKYQPIGTVSGDSIRTLTAPGTVKIFATAPVAYSSDIYSNYVVKILNKTLQVYTPGTTTTVLRKSCAGTLKVENVLGPITVSGTVIPIEQDSARWSVPKSDIDFVCLSNTGRTAKDAKYGATVACVLSKEATALFFVYKLPNGKSSHYLLATAATDWTAAADIDAAQQPIHSTMNKYFGAGNKDHANIVAYSNYPPHFKFELPMSPGKGLIIAEEQNKGFWLVHTAKYFPNLAGVIGDLFSNEKTTKDAAAFLCMSYSDVNLKAIAKIIDYEQPIVFFTQRSAAQATQAFYDSSEIQTLVNGLHTYQPTASVSGDSIKTLTPPGTVKIFATAPVAYSCDIYSNYAVKILKKSLQVYTPGTTTTVLKKSCAGSLKVENVLGPITVKDTVIPIGQDSARWSVPKSDSDFVCLSNTGRTIYDAKYGATVACVLSKDAAALFRKMITKENLDACT
ncbi:Cell-death-related nuclease 7 [Trichinella pseudospiralis]|uniref:Cell-death-related nuclease 7 n=1 Tax=Trichinella pseudospiralis TaxID=6337 RepID=A0A0V1G5D9_TRIPS|nr:Cell-death-related nuclease 7 [Trichinella pseudospiralis]